MEDNPGCPSANAAPGSRFSEAVSFIDAAAARKADERMADDAAAQAEKEKGMALGAKNHQPILLSAQTVARKLAQNGPVTIDDVIREMRRLGYRESDIKPGEKVAKNWKGSVFADAEWICVGQIASREKSAHGRNVRQWALRSWLKTHPVNGTNSDASAFKLFNIYQEAVHHYPAGELLCWVIGRDCLDLSFTKLTMTRGLKYLPDGRVSYERPPDLYGLPVHIVDGVGAMCVPRRTLQNNLRNVSIADGHIEI